ncbi:MAG: metal ABC transporter substrate-binding protein [Thermomicrobiales bacterium]|nr:metal ABC transporter substrate-binding protein [Thermomicrobiales bacterium]MCO5229306.1 metal ABC transporter substrate-binding protein [Thermomicrobiales bacterium]
MAFTLNRRAFMGVAGTLVLATRPLAAQERLSIATSMPILEDIVSNIVGESADVFSIMPANADPHTWEATPEDMVRVTEASAFIYIGALLEPFVETGGWRRTVRDNDIPELVVTDHVELIVVDMVIDHGDHVHDLRGGDPHIWLDPLTMVQAVPAIADFLAELDPDNAEAYKANAETYAVSLEELHANLEEAFASIPEERRKLLVFHDAFRYFAARYDFEIIGIVLENPDSEASARDIADLLNVIDESGIDVVFAEPQFNTSVLDVLSAEGDVTIATLLTDSFADEVDTYIGLMEFNRDQIVEYLGAG